jgi:uncharacterized protein
MTYRTKLETTDTKKLLALDGGGIRGLISIEVLAKIEMLLREASNNPELVLADYFDYIGGTSTGAVVGTLLALGKSVSEIRDIYLQFGEMMFQKAALYERFETIYKLKQYTSMVMNTALNLLPGVRLPYAEYRHSPLAKKLKELVGDNDVTLCATKLKTLLLIVLSNASTDSPWPISNNPFAMYNDPDHPSSNAHIPLWRLVRASTAAPTVFRAQEIMIAGRRHVFVDGGVTPYNNPALQLFLQATLEPYQLQWPSGEKKMLLVSVGTGLTPLADARLRARHLGFPKIAQSVLATLFNSAIYQQDLVCRTLGNCRAGDPLDREVGDLINKKGPAEPKLFTYIRYNATLTRKGLDDLGLEDVEPSEIEKLDSVKYMRDLRRIGERVARFKVKSEHFADFCPE